MWITLILHRKKMCSWCNVRSRVTLYRLFRMQVWVWPFPSKSTPSGDKEGRQCWVEGLRFRAIWTSELNRGLTGKAIFKPSHPASSGSLLHFALFQHSSASLKIQQAPVWCSPHSSLSRQSTPLHFLHVASIKKKPITNTLTNYITSIGTSWPHWDAFRLLWSTSDRHNASASDDFRGDPRSAHSIFNLFSV